MLASHLSHSYRTFARYFEGLHIYSVNNPIFSLRGRLCQEFLLRLLKYVTSFPEINWLLTLTE